MKAVDLIPLLELHHTHHHSNLCPPAHRGLSTSQVQRKPNACGSPGARQPGFISPSTARSCPCPSPVLRLISDVCAITATPCTTPPTGSRPRQKARVPLQHEEKEAVGLLIARRCLFCCCSGNTNHHQHGTSRPPLLLSFGCLLPIPTSHPAQIQRVVGIISYFFSVAACVAPGGLKDCLMKRASASPYLASSPACFALPCGFLRPLSPGSKKRILRICLCFRLVN